MSNPKERHYWSQLRAALTAGQWRSDFPAKDPKGNPLSWSELFRKFNKHCHGYKDVSEVASQTQALALLLSDRYSDDDEDGEPTIEVPPESGDNDALKRGRLALESESILPEERIEEGKVGYEILKALNASQFDTIHLALAYYAYALGYPKDCIDYLGKVPQLLQFQNHIPHSDSMRSEGPQTLLAPSSYAPSTTSFTGSFASLVESTAPEVRDGRGWAMTETFRSLCLKGMSYEKLYPDDPSKALEAYDQALPLFAALRGELSPKSLPKPQSPAGKPEYPLFSKLREMWRWVERLLWRGVILSGRISDIVIEEHTSKEGGTSVNATAPMWTWFSHYTMCGSFWPPSFRTAHRCTVYALYLRALVLQFGVLVSPPSEGMAPLYGPPAKKRYPSNTSRPTSEPSTRPPTSLSTTPPGPTPDSDPFHSMQPTPTSWSHVARSVAQDYRAVLSASTTFPRAGERNIKVEEFVELCVKVWEASGSIGEQAGWVIDILEWSQRLTFNSSMILRHLTRLLYLGSAPYLAKRTLQLYIQVVGKAWEASKEGVGEDMDEDSKWVETLVFGARMLCAGVGGPTGLVNNFSASVPPGQTTSPDDGIDEVLEALSILEKARTRLDEKDKRLVAQVLLAEGIAWSLAGVKDCDPQSRSLNFEKAHAYLTESIREHPTPAAYYHLAISFSRRLETRVEKDAKHERETNFSSAIESAGQAVEGAPKDVRYWHLLGLLLSTTGKWSEAKEILERGADLDDVDEEAEAVSEVGTEEGNGQLNVNKKSAMEDTTDQDRDSVTVTVTQNQVEAQTSLITRQGSSQPVAVGTGANDYPLRVRLLQQTEQYLPSAASLQHPAVLLPSQSASTTPDSSTAELTSTPSVPSLTIDQYPPSSADLFEQHLQIRMTLVTLVEVVEGPEGAEEGWLDVFSWVAEKRGAANKVANSNSHGGDSINARHSEDLGGSHHVANGVANDGLKPSTSTKHLYPELGVKSNMNDSGAELVVPIGITISPATPDTVGNSDKDIGNRLEDQVDRAELNVQTRRSYESFARSEEVVEWDGEGYLKEKPTRASDKEKEKLKEKEREKDRKNNNNAGYAKSKRSSSTDRADFGKTSNKVHQILRGSVHKGKAGISAMSRKVKSTGLRRSTSTPDFHAALHPTSYQASSIHSRRRLSSIAHSGDGIPMDSPPPPPPPSLPSSTQQQQQTDFQPKNARNARETRLLSNLWLMSAATFRRLGKIEQAKGSIQEGEVKDENNPGVWVQLGLYYVALGFYQHAIDTLQKARFISPDDVAATVHLARLYLDPNVTRKIHSLSGTPPSHNPSSSRGPPGHDDSDSSNPSPDVDLAVGMLSQLTASRGWDVPEAWYYLARGYGMQGRKEKEREMLKLALELSERRGVRDVGSALGWCI